jgi:hypothetical protein
MLSTYALKQDVRSILKQMNKGTKDIVPDSLLKEYQANYETVRERFADMGEVCDFGFDTNFDIKKDCGVAEFLHDGYHMNFTVSGRYNVVSELKRRGPKRKCYCSTAFRLAKGLLRQKPNSLGNCKEHLFVLEDKDEKRIGNILQHYEDGNTGLYVTSGRYSWKSGICTGDAEDLQLGISPRKQTKIWELELRELLAAQRKLIGHLRTAER